MPWLPDSHSRRLRKQRGRGDLDREYEERRRMDPALGRAGRIRNSRRWRKVRLMKLRRDPLCEDCTRQGRTEAATQVHHVEGLATRPDLAFEMSNLMSICTAHHALREAEERTRDR